ncbi:MAG: hypothetical protein M9907_00580 [Burkholderiaceae bacterium]|nr:hypothetical protein [Burkholderiaceae bacterium]
MSSHPDLEGALRAKRSLSAMLVAAALAAGGIAGTPVLAATDHAHEHAGPAHPLELNAGRKWATDEPLRQGMTRIRDAVSVQLPAVHRGKMDAAQYDALGGEIEAQLAHIVGNCKLDPKADEMLHVILAGVIEGNEIIRGHDAKAKRSAGVVKVVHALEQYGKYFEHPGWKAPKLAH